MQNLKRATFKVAKAIKEAGYPQTNLGYSKLYEKVNGAELWIAQPTYLDVWLWLWREKGIFIDITGHTTGVSVHIYNKNIHCIENKDFYPIYNDPEEAIIAAIKHLVDNDLVK